MVTGGAGNGAERESGEDEEEVGRDEGIGCSGGVDWTGLVKVELIFLCLSVEGRIWR